MPQTLAIGALVLSAVLILIAVLGGRFKIFGVEIQGTSGRVGRIIAGFVGLLILVGLLISELAIFPQKQFASNQFASPPQPVLSPQVTDTPDPSPHPSPIVAKPTERADQSEVSPKPIATSPKNGATDVEPSLSEITVIFSKPMMDMSWSWVAEDKSSFPKMTGQPYYADNETTCVQPVKLEPGKRYVIWINSSRFKNFKDKSGNAVEPYKLVFTTRQ